VVVGSETFDPALANNAALVKTTVK
jgi:hypothetical protein